MDIAILQVPHCHQIPFLNLLSIRKFIVRRRWRYPIATSLAVSFARASLERGETEASTSRRNAGTRVEAEAGSIGRSIRNIRGRLRTGVVA